MAGKDLDGRGLAGVVDVPVVDGRVGDEAEGVLANPLPVLDILVHRGRLELRLGLEVEDLQHLGLGLQGDNMTGPVHDGAVGLYGAPDDIVVVLEVDDDDFGLAVLRLLYADVGIRLECLETPRRTR